MSQKYYQYIVRMCVGCYETFEEYCETFEECVKTIVEHSRNVLELL